VVWDAVAHFCNYSPLAEGSFGGGGKTASIGGGKDSDGKKKKETWKSDNLTGRDRNIKQGGGGTKGPGKISKIGGAWATRGYSHGRGVTGGGLGTSWSAEKAARHLGGSPYFCVPPFIKNNVSIWGGEENGAVSAKLDTHLVLKYYRSA